MHPIFYLRRHIFAGRMWPQWPQLPPFVAGKSQKKIHLQNLLLYSIDITSLHKLWYKCESGYLRVLYSLCPWMILTVVAFSSICISLLLVIIAPIKWNNYCYDKQSPKSQQDKCIRRSELVSPFDTCIIPFYGTSHTEVS